MLRELDLDLGGEREGGPPVKLLCDGLDDGRIGVAVDERRHVVGEIDPLDTLDVRDAAAGSVIHVEWMRFAEHGVAAHATGQDP